MIACSDALNGDSMAFSKVLYFMTMFFTTTSMIAESKTPKIAVVGAGLAGLTTAYRLQQKGMDVDVYEARSRVGGRILTAKVRGHIAELGGQNITDGGEAKNMRRLIEELDLELISDTVSLNYAYYTGKELIFAEQLLRNNPFDPENLRIKLNKLMQESTTMRDVLRGILEEENPLYKTLAVRLAGYEGATIEKLSPIYTETLYHMLLGGLSAVHQGAGIETYIDLLSIKGGNALLPEKLAQKLEGKLHLNTPLKRVSKNLDHTFALTFQDDQIVTADILVLAIPCSVYQEIIFDQNILPLTRLQDIQKVQYGTNAKILIPFSAPPPARIGFFNDRLGCFFDVNCNILTLYYTDITSRFSAETIMETYQQDRPMLEIGFGNALPPFSTPVLAEDQSFASYENPVGYSWPNDPYAKGSYSYIAPGQEAQLTTIKEEQGEKVKVLFAPINQQLYFAGEHTSILLEAPGTMEAACESGERTSRMIINSVNL
ncbi:hypothetical protein pah_c026o146 [Parachlamydia acanthamoebae str. Hall's coccus]|jgi:monoamine oxidase|nr:hypothetical protein pah_c026o146 [Parachlamydia acanthamoebae str. Hall's coccus]